jgi:hypothetical protein
VNPEENSRWPCPVCGQHRLALEEFPHIDTLGFAPYTDVIGMGDPGKHALPGISCLNCGTRWASPEAFASDTRTPDLEPG